MQNRSKLSTKDIVLSLPHTMPLSSVSALVWAWYLCGRWVIPTTEDAAKCALNGASGIVWC